MIVQRIIFLVLCSVGMALVSTVASAAPAQQAGPTATPTATPATACVSQAPGVVINIFTPNPGDVLTAGSNVVVSGIAYDSTAASGTGVDRVSVYFGDRDKGGLFWGDAVRGLPNPQAGSGPLSTAGFSLRSPTIPAGSGGRDIFVYAHSSETNREGVASVPVFLGAAPTPVRGQVPTPVLPPPPACTPTPVPTAVPTSTPTPLPPTPTSPPVVVAATATPPPASSLPPIPAAPLPAAPAAAAPAPAAAAPAPAAVAPATATTAPRGGGMPREVGLLLLGIGAVVVGGGYGLRRRERRGPASRD